PEFLGLSLYLWNVERSLHLAREVKRRSPLSLLPDTAMRVDAEREGVVFDPAPPYRVRHTATMTEDAWRDAFFAAEERLGRRLDEHPRPPPGGANGQPDPPDVSAFALAPKSDGLCARRGAQQAALWLYAEDLSPRRDRIIRAIDARLAVDPYATL